MGIFDGFGMRWDGKLGSEVRFGGLDVGGRATVVAQDYELGTVDERTVDYKRVVVVHIEGSSCWAGIGTPRIYTGSRIVVLRAEPSGDGTWELEEIIEVEMAAIRNRKRREP